MAMGVPHKGSGSRRRRRAPMADINVTPMVDVMLVLLIVFMVTAPLLVTGVPVDLPKTKARALEENQAPLTVTIDHNGAIFLGDAQINADQLLPRLTAIAEAKGDPRIYVRADSRLAYGQVMAVMGQLNGAGFRKVALVSQPQK